MPVRQTEGGQGSPGKRYLCEVYSTLAVIGMVRLLMDPSLGCQVCRSTLVWTSGVVCRNSLFITYTLLEDNFLVRLANIGALSREQA